MYSAEQVVHGLRNPREGFRELNRLYWNVAGGRTYNGDGVDVFEEDWDNLLILDGCRPDVLADRVREYEIDGDLETRTSRGSATAEFLNGNFDGKQLDDVVYVTASTMLYQESVFRERIDVELHDVFDVWSEAIDYGDDGVSPVPVAETAREAAREYPHKRLIVHFLQPHAPYIGELGRSHFPDYRPNPLAERFRGLIETPEDVLRDIYAENLDLALERVEELLPDLAGKTVVTADHGMLLGERERPIPVKSYGHPGGLYVDEMVEVPWLVIESDERKRIVAGEPDEQYAKKRSDDLDEQAREHLAQLGYL